MSSRSAEKELGGWCKRFRWILFATVMSFAVSGCVQKSSANGEHVYHYELWVPLTVLLAGFVAVPVGLFLYRKIARLGWVLLLAGIFAVILGAPSLFLDRVIVNHERFHMRTGFWGCTAVHSLEFAEIKEIHIIDEAVRIGRTGKGTNYFLNCEMKEGGSRKVPANNAVTKLAAEEILRQAKAHGIPVRNETDGL